jgi:hypothetical protein
MPSRITSGKLIALGTVIALAAGGAATAIWQANQKDFTRLLGFWIAVAVFVLGFLLVVVGVTMRDPGDGGTPPTQSQRGGDHSTLYQAGRDIRSRGD